MARNASASSSASLLSFGLFRERTWRRGAAASRRCLVVSYFDKRWVTGCRYASWLGGARWLVVRVWRYDTETSILRRYGSWTYTTTATTFFFSRSGGRGWKCRNWNYTTHKWQTKWKAMKLTVQIWSWPAGASRPQRVELSTVQSFYNL